MRSPVGAVLLIGLLWPGSSAAQQYDLRTFSLEAGLPSASVNDICEDTEGFLWVATDQGLARSQGSRFEAFDQQQGAPNAEATALLASTTSTGEGIVWTGYRSGQLAVWYNGAFTTFRTTTPLPTFPVRALLPGKGNTLWLASRGGGVWKVDTAAHSTIAVHDGLPSLRINALVKTDGDVLLAGTDSGLFQLNGARWIALGASKELAGRRVLSLFADSAGVLVGTSDGFLELGTDLVPLPIVQRFAGFQPLVLPHPVVLSVLRERGHLWLGTPGGLVHITRSRGVPTLISIKERNGLGHDLVRCLHQDRSGGIWAGTGYGGVSKFTSDAFLYFTERDGLGSRIVSAIHRTPDGLLWVATQGGGVARSDGKDIKLFGREAGLPSLFITCLEEDEEGYLIAGTAMHGLYRLRNEHFEPAWVPEDRDAQRIHSVQRTANGELYIGSGRGLYRLNGKAATLMSAPERSIFAITAFKDSIWLGTDSGLYALRAGSTGTMQRIAEIPMVALNDLTRDSQGSIWIGSAERGLLRLHGTQLEEYGRDAGLQSTAVELVLLDAYENLWLGTRQGMHQVELDVMQDQVLDIRAYGPEDGFVGIESLRGAGMLDTDSSLWFGTVRGAIRYDQRKVVEDPREPLIHLTDLQLFYERPDWTPWCKGLGRNGFPSDLQLPHNKNHLTFAFTGISLAYPEKVRYRWILEGYDPDWSPITATQRVTYSNIPPGDYTFKVMARNASGIWNEEPIKYSFVIAPPFWQTNTFRIGGGAVLLLAIFGIVRIRTRKLRKDRERLEGMVQVRTSELAEEKERSDELLRNILPASTAEELKRKGTAEAHRYESCTVLFSDFKGFTGFSSLMDSDTLVSELDHYFRLFDRLTDIYGTEKIKTIGDAYMCASGIPEPDPAHALNALLMGLAMLEAVEKSNADRERKGMTEWPVRIGIHTGPVVAGVVGEKKFAYDIWGDTVNLASRMESHGEAGRLNISGVTYAQVMDYVEVAPRGPIKVKGKGELNMYFVLRLKAEWSADPKGRVPNDALLALRSQQ